MKPIIISLYCLLITLASCNKSDDSFTPTLPPITQTGENTFGCYANGVLITPRDGTGTFNLPDYGLRVFIGPGPTEFIYHEIKVNDFASDKTSSITMHIVGLDSLGIGEYMIKQSNCYGALNGPATNHIFCRIWNDDEKIYKSYCSIENSGIINITRYDNGIISGTFSFRAAAFEDPTDVIQITEGRFDINTNALPDNFP